MIKTIVAASAAEFDEKVNAAEVELAREGFQVFASQTHAAPQGVFVAVLMFKRAGLR